MGKVVVYCYRCKTRLVSDQFEANKAIELVNRSVCLACAKEIVDTLLPEEQAIVRAKLAPPPVAAVVEPPPPEPPSPPPHALPTSPADEKDPFRPPTSRQLKTRRASPRPQNSSPAVAVIGGGLLLGLVLVLVMSSGSRNGSGHRPSAQPPDHLPDDGPSARIPPSYVPDPPGPPDDPGPRHTPQPRRSDPTREAAAHEALREAVEFAKANEGDFRGIVKKFRHTQWIAEGTSVYDRVVKAAEPYERQLRDILDAGEKEVDAKVRTLTSQKRYKDLFKYLEDEVKSFEEPDWANRVTAKLDKVRADLNFEYGTLSDLAKTHARGKRLTEALAVLEPLRRYDVEFMNQQVARLEPELQQLAAGGGGAGPPISPPIDPGGRGTSEADRKAIQALLQEAGRIASTRNYSGAMSALGPAAEKAAGTPQEGDVARFQEALQRVASLFQAVCQSLARSRSDSEPEVEITFVDRPKSKTVKGRVVHIDDSVLHLREAKMGRDSRVIPLDLLTADFVVAVAKATLTSDAALRRDLAAFLAFEGEYERARAELASEAGGLPETLRSIKKSPPTSKSTKLSESPEWAKREKEAEKAYSAAKRTYSQSPEAGIEEFRRVLEAYRETGFVDSKLKEIEEIVNRGREYVIAARDFKELTAGWKRQPVRAKEVKFAAVLEKEIDNSKPPTDWITIEFMVTANTKYRFWAFVGGCCEPEMMFKVQGDDVVLTMGDGQSKAFPIDGPSAISFGATPIGSHSGHGGQTRWGWSRMFELTYPSGGVKRIRFIPAARGTALSHFVVSSGRYLQANPPPPNELENGQ